MNRDLLRIEILYFEGCPNYDPTLALLREVVAELRVAAPINEVEVRDEEGAARLRFPGSPTIRIDGEDIEAPARPRTDFSMSCRFYEGSGVPPRSLIEAALRRHGAS